MRIDFSWQRKACPECHGRGLIGINPKQTRSPQNDSSMTAYVTITYEREEICPECNGTMYKWAYAPVERDGDDY